MTDIVADQDAVEAFWQDYCIASGTDEDALDAVEHFGDSAEMADTLLALVLDGTKKATASLASDFEMADEPLPQVGGHWIVVDGQGVPRCVLKTVQIRVGLLGSVDEAFAWDEGEGGRTRDWWVAAHRGYFTRQGEASGLAFDESKDRIVFERFEVVWAG